MQDLVDMWPGNQIHQTAIIDDTVKMGTENIIGPYTIIGPDVVIGNRNNFYGHASIGLSAQHKNFGSTHFGRVIIGNSNHFREYVTVHRATTFYHTTIGNNCYFMACSHVPHDAVIGDDVTMCNNVLLAGHTHVMKGATLGLGTIVHQYQVIGAYAITGMGTIITKNDDILCGKKFVGNPARMLGPNTIGLERAGVGAAELGVYGDEFWELKAKHK